MDNKRSGCIGYRLFHHISSQIPYIHDHGSAFGALYVLEGSTLGGLIIKKMISEKLGSEEGMSFFEGYGKKTAERWKVFTHILNQIDTDHNTADIVVKTAASTFMLFNSWMQQTYTPAKQAE